MYRIKFWIQNRWYDFICKQWDKMPYSIHYRYVSSWLKVRVQEANEGHYFKCLIESYEKPLDN